ncbi:MAG: sigma 54-interacting transcriptional regulator [Halioglobus sp.]
MTQAVRKSFGGQVSMARVVIVEANDHLRADVVAAAEGAGVLQVVADLPVLENSIGKTLEPDLLIMGLGGGADSHDAEALDLCQQLQQSSAVQLIFLVATEASVELNDQLTACQPLAIVWQSGTLPDPGLQTTLNVAIAQYLKLRALNCAFVDQQRDIKDLNASLLYIDQSSQQITRINDSAQQLFGLADHSSSDLPWWKVLGAKSASAHPLAQLIKGGPPAVIPPTLLARPGDATPLVVCGNMTSIQRQSSVEFMLNLRNLDSANIRQLVKTLMPKDTLLIFSVDKLNQHDARDNSVATLMMDLRTSLLEIVRRDDQVSLPVGPCIAIRLHNTSEDESEDLARALLSHLQSVKAVYGEMAESARFSVGLVQRSLSMGAIETIVAANNAMFCVQLEPGSNARIKIASENDRKILASYRFSTDGIFASPQLRGDYCNFLNDLAAILDQQLLPADSMEQAVATILKQQGLFTSALFLKAKDGSYDFAVGGKKTGDGFLLVSESSLPDSAFLPSRYRTGQGIISRDNISPDTGSVIQPLFYRQQLVGYLALAFDQTQPTSTPRLILESGALHMLACLAQRSNGRTVDTHSSSASPAKPMEQEIDGYVVDNMEGAVDQATFLAKLDMPVAIVGARGTGKMYIAKIVHQEWGGAPGMIVQIDCREFKKKETAIARLGEQLENSEGKTLVFKSPQLMSPEVQNKLARQLSTRMLADANPPRYLPRAKYVALFPAPIEGLVRKGELSERLASVFIGYPINVPPIRDRKQAVLRWAYKILGQESTAQKKSVSGFTPDAEQALLTHDWQGNISEMRECIVIALERTDKEWITPVDLGIFKGISAEGTANTADPKPFLTEMENKSEGADDYAPSVLEELDVALGQVVNEVVSAQNNFPLGSWLEDELVLATLDRYKNDYRLAAEFLHTKSRNITRWMPKIEARAEERNSHLAWRDPSRLIREWIRQSAHLPSSPMSIAQTLLLLHVSSQCDNAGIGASARAKIMGVSVPTYNKRRQQAIS